jgi:hypothetical protein
MEDDERRRRSKMEDDEEFQTPSLMLAGEMNHPMGRRDSEEVCSID